MGTFLRTNTAVCRIELDNILLRSCQRKWPVKSGQKAIKDYCGKDVHQNRKKREKVQSWLAINDWNTWYLEYFYTEAER